MITDINKFLRKSIALFLVSLMVAGCVTTSGASTVNLSADEKRLRAQEDEFNSTVAGGVIAGALAGALIGVLIGGDAKSGAIGAGVGAVAGGGAGNYVASKKKQYATEQARLDSVRQDVKNDNLRVAQMINITERVIDKNKTELQQMRRMVAAGTKKRGDMNALLAKVSGHRDSVNKSISGLKNRKTQYFQASSSNSNSNAETRAEISKLNNQISSLERQVQQFDKILEVNRIS